MDEAILDQAYLELQQLAEALTDDASILLCRGDIIAVRTGRNRFLLERSGV